MSYLPASPTEPPPTKQSKLGVVALILSLLGLVVFCIAFLLAFGLGFSAAIQDPNFDPVQLERSPFFLLSSVLFCLSPVFLLIGIGLAIATIFQTGAKKTLGIVALGISSVILLALCVLFLIGFLVQADRITF
ncbi:MAG: hypothetical protein N2049_00940 [Anaerolineales bacterium]|nr:hypothetical protein [Anaerolineales bacterium]MCX7607771.1 hypothetical protein [Anaerolineales bacterium]MDW8227011.1 hypothetical protein [Anaerolineales bacterium]